MQTSERHRFAGQPPAEHTNSHGHGHYAATPPRATYTAEDVHRQNAAAAAAAASAANFHPYQNDSKSMQQHQPVISRPIPIHQNYHRPYDVQATSHDRIEYTRQPTPFNSTHAQMNPPPMSSTSSSSQKWPAPSQQQNRITQSPISLASSPHSVSSQSTNQLYPSPHATPSPSSFGYPAAPSPVSTQQVNK